MLMVTTLWSGVHQLLPKCHVHIAVKIKFSVKEYLLPVLVSVTWNLKGTSFKMASRIAVHSDTFAGRMIVQQSPQFAMIRGS